MRKRLIPSHDAPLGELAADRGWLAAIAAAALDLRRRERGRATPIGTGADLLAERIIVRRAAAGCIYVHRWMMSDPDELHDHPWDFVSLVLTVGYWEETPGRRTWRAPGEVVFHKAERRHRIALETDRSYTRGATPTSLIVTGPERREWGFHTADGWVPGRDYRARPRRQKTQS
jgi:hypothetical protein